MSRQDPAALGTSGYERLQNDHYVTPERTVRSLLSVIRDDVPSFAIWEPFCGDGAFTNLLKDDALNIVSTDIEKYGDFEPDALMNFFDIKTQKAAEFLRGNGVDHIVTTLEDVAKLKGFTPDIIISNPPYTEAERCVRHAIELMQESKGDVIMLLRNEWDCAKSRKDLFDHPAFYGKIVLHHRPRWIAGSTGAPRHNYAYFWWSWSKALAHPSARAELYYAE